MQMSEPRDFWIFNNDQKGFAASVTSSPVSDSIHVREVIEGEPDWKALCATLKKDLDNINKWVEQNGNCEASMHHIDNDDYGFLIMFIQNALENYRAAIGDKNA